MRDRGRLEIRYLRGSHTFICEGVTSEDDVFVGHNVSFINDKYPRSTSEFVQMQTQTYWKVIETRVDRGASIGTTATILCGVTVGENAIMDAGSVVPHDAPDNALLAGVPAPPVKNKQRMASAR